jgi:hypothetical protein
MEPDDGDDMFEPGTAANHEALELLRELLVDVGFRVAAKERREATLRVYAGDGDFPLLNPRFEPEADAFGLPDSDEAIVFSVWTREPAPELRRHLAASPREGLHFVADDRRSAAGDHLVGWLVVPLVFVEEDAGEASFDLDALERTLGEIRELLAGSR